MGHLPVNVDHRRVPLESVASCLSVQNHLSAAGHGIQDIDTLARLYGDNDPALRQWLNIAAPAFGQVVRTIENLFDPQTVILGGAMPPVMLDHLVATIPLSNLSVSARADTPWPRLKRGMSGRQTATKGAAALVLNRFFTPHARP